MLIPARKLNPQATADGRQPATVNPRLRLAALALAALLSGQTLSGAWAQSGLNTRPSGVSTGRHGSAAPPEKAALAPPDAIPGAKAREPAAPASKTVGDLAPNDALFDAINRGDIASARDALNRGADLNAVNILGMTPMELSVDLGRNDISFLLLSMRGEDSSRGARTVGRDAAASPTDAKPTAMRRVAGKPPTPARPTVVATKPGATPKLFANDGGTPLPSAGFLGFGSHPASN